MTSKKSKGGINEDRTFNCNGPRSWGLLEK